MIRVAAVGDVHLGADSRGELRPALDMVSAHADVLLLAGDLTRHGVETKRRLLPTSSQIWESRLSPYSEIMTTTAMQSRTLRMRLLRKGFLYWKANLSPSMLPGKR